MLRIEFNGNGKTPGYIDYTISNWKGSATNLKMSIQRNQDNYYLSSGGHWVIEPAWHTLDGAVLNNNELQGELGPWLVDVLCQQTANVRFLLVLGDGNTQDRGPIRMVGNILASSAEGDTSRGETIFEAPQVTEVAIEEPVEEIIEEEVEEVIEEPIDTFVVEPPQKPKKKWWILILVFLLLIGVASGLAYYFFFDKPQNNTDLEATTNTVVTALPCQLQGNKSDEMSFIQTCLKTSPKTEVLLTLIEEAKKAKKCNIAQRLYANQAQSGNTEIAVAYAKEYEVGSDCFSVDKDTAIYWYETALMNDPNNAVAKQKLEELKK